MSTEKHTIRPAGRHILTIGRDLIKDQPAALVELVKNAYDSDSPDVEIVFQNSPAKPGYTICIKDRGHGMSKDVMIDKWMVPSTDDKQKRKRSPGGRIMQGSKGVGRYAASVLGRDLLLETIAPVGMKTTLFVDWDDFKSARYLSDVEVLMEFKKVNQPSGTCLTIHADNNEFPEWKEKQFKVLKTELRKLISPVDKISEFKIYITVDGYFEGQEKCTREEVEPFPLLESFDYKIAGKISRNGTGRLLYATQKARNTIEKPIAFNFGNPTGCGDLVFDIRVYDRDKDSLDALVRRGLGVFSSGMGRLDARNLLNVSSGIGVYRNGFRISPLGDPDFDWLKLNKGRIQNPSLRIGSDQVIGFVEIQSESESNLLEKSARDGIKESIAFENLKNITRSVIGELETRRYAYRAKAGLSRKVVKIEQQLEDLYSLEGLTQSVRRKLKEAKIDQKTTGEIIALISKESKEKTLLMEQMRRNFAIYQGQATLGKIINVVIHEGRHPISYIKNQIPNLRHLLELISVSENQAKMSDFIRISEGIKSSSEKLVTLFRRIDPLASKNRSRKRYLQMKKVIARAISVFEAEMVKQEISLKIIGSGDFKFLAWEQDISAIFTNLADNSIYWMKHGGLKKRQISITLKVEDGSLKFIDYRDTGPGIEPSLIDSGVIFEPNFTTKPDGMGLGLAIAGEAASRNGLELEAFEADSGAFFRLRPQEGE